MHRIGRVGRAGREGVAITLAEPREHRLLKNIERVTKQQITIEKVPTVADLRNRRMEHHAAPRSARAIIEDDLDQYRVVVETLADEFDVMEVALAAVKLAHEAGGGPAEDADIPDVSLHSDKPARKGATGGAPRRDSGSGGPSPTPTPRAGVPERSGGSPRPG